MIKKITFAILIACLIVSCGKKGDPVYKESQKKTSEKDAVVCGHGKLLGVPVHLAVYNFQFMGGSMGSVVGEKIARAINRATLAREALIIFSTSGGARMQEGLISLMQMAKTCSALAKMQEQNTPMISIMTHPTTGGVAASYAMLGDINIAEPGALIGFAGPRVIKQTIGQDLPEGFQTSEYLLEHGMLDIVLHRTEIREELIKMIHILMKKPQAIKADLASPNNHET